MFYVQIDYTILFCKLKRFRNCFFMFFRTNYIKTLDFYDILTTPIADYFLIENFTLF